MTTPHQPSLPGPRSANAAFLLRLWDSLGMVLLYLVLFTLCALFIPGFLSRLNLLSLAQSIITVGIVASGMFLCLVSGDFDLSVGSVASFSAIIAVMTVNHFTPVAPADAPFPPDHQDPSWPMLLGIPAGVLAGAVCGCFNGFLTAVVRVNALIVTLATMLIVRGLAFIISDNRSLGSFNFPFNRLFGTRTFLTVPAPIWVLMGCMALAGLLLHFTTFGRKALAIGGNLQAAQYSGIDVARTRILIFTLLGALSGLAGLVDASQLKMADPKAYSDLALAAISACVLGGVSLTGGVGTILAVVVGTLIMGTVQNAMTAQRIDSNKQYVITGGILLAAVLYDRLKQRLVRS